MYPTTTGASSPGFIVRNVAFVTSRLARAGGIQKIAATSGTAK
jgi:hypothetical protein